MAALCRCLCPFRRRRGEQLLDAETGSSISPARHAPPIMTARDLLTLETCFYMNFKILNIEEAFPKIMRAKVRTAGKEWATSFAGTVGYLLASRPKFGRVFSNKIAEKLTQLLPYKLADMGITFKLAKTYSGEMGYIVLRAEVVELDLLKLLESVKGTEFSERLAPLIGMARRFKDIDRALVPKVQQQIMRKLEKEMPIMLWEKACFKLLLICKSSAEQAEFFFDTFAGHKLEVAFKVLNRAEAAPRLAKERVAGHFGDEIGRGKLLGMCAGAVASHVAAQAPDKLFGKIVARRLSDILPMYLANAGITLAVMEVFSAMDANGATVLRCDVTDVDLDTFIAKLSPRDAVARRIAQGEHILTLGSKGRAEVYDAVRNYIRVQFPQHLLSQKGLEVEMIVRDIGQMDGPPDMIDIEGLSDSDESHAEDDTITEDELAAGS